MKVTSVHLTINKSKNVKFKGWAKVVFDDLLLVTGIRFYEDKSSENGPKRFILFPDRRPSLASTGGEIVSIAVVNTKDEELRQHITDSIYDKILASYKSE